MDNAIRTRMVVPPAADFLSPGTPVLLAADAAQTPVLAIVIERAQDDGQHYQLAWFDRRYWQVRRCWHHYTQFVVCGDASR